LIDFNVLKDFEWHRDKKGYRLAPHNSLQISLEMQGRLNDEIVIVPKGAPSDSIEYRPFAGGGDLCAAFASIKSPDELLRFVNHHGLLTTVRRPSSETERSRNLWTLSAESVSCDLDFAKMFRQLLRLKAEGNPRKLASYFELKCALETADIFGSGMASVELAGDPKRGIRFKVCPPNFLGALWYQLGLKLSSATLRMCPLCHRVFEVGGGTGLRADAKFCCHEHKVDFFNHNRSRLTRRSNESKK
jgi:hypothetical protein